MVKKIGTHNGPFHCDDATACFMLKSLPEYRDAQIIRTRDQNELDQCDVVVDVGGVYDHVKNRYDHHQRPFNESMHSLNSIYQWTTKLSSAGLVYYHFGKAIIKSILDDNTDNECIDLVYEKVYHNFIESIDAIDNGISLCGETPRYVIKTDISSRVSYLLPKWNEEPKNFDEKFTLAMSLVGGELTDRIIYYARTWYPARLIVAKSLEDRYLIDETGEIIELPQGGLPWKDHLFTLEEKDNLKGCIKFVIYKEQSQYRILAVPVFADSFKSRIPLNQSWQGLRDLELVKASGIESANFVHSSGFTGGCHTREGVIEMAKKTIAMAL